MDTNTSPLRNLCLARLGALSVDNRLGSTMRLALLSTLLMSTYVNSPAGDGPA
jgi:hypothetical protein